MLFTQHLSYTELFCMYTIVSCISTHSRFLQPSKTNKEGYNDSVVYFLGSSVAQELEYQIQKKRENDSAIGTSIRTTSRHHIAASNVSHSCTAINRTDPQK